VVGALREVAGELEGSVGEVVVRSGHLEASLVMPRKMESGAPC
jgi:hypothetical protein